MVPWDGLGSTGKETLGHTPWGGWWVRNLSPGFPRSLSILSPRGAGSNHLVSLSFLSPSLLSLSFSLSLSHTHTLSAVTSPAQLILCSWWPETGQGNQRANKPYHLLSSVPRVFPPIEKQVLPRRPLSLLLHTSTL